MHKAFKPGTEPKGYNFEEMCPHCDTFIPVVVDNDEAIEYEVVCPVCGKPMMLCTLCHWDQQEEEGYCGDRCDWCAEGGCFRKRKTREVSRP